MLTPREKMLSVKAHAYFTKEKAEGRAGSHRPVRQRIAERLDFGGTTISLVMADWNRHHDPAFPARDAQGAPIAKPKRGHPRHALDTPFVAGDIRELVRKHHFEGKPVTAAIVRQHLIE
ncbi:hypothetical protein ACHHYP_20841 [Achlya hypogyna]|uniref:Uncharacterized protein n=1 Tax=Achlya hypogyna TaxID=1202772 RepID=A0A1V9Y5J1_ACHHY|nr:hypothetical protein ACHHYP_20841 [Achlya hypogyna]